jgi:hypothetical protein
MEGRFMDRKKRPLNPRVSKKQTDGQTVNLRIPKKQTDNQIEKEVSKIIEEHFKAKKLSRVQGIEEREVLLSLKTKKSKRKP